MTHGTLDRGKFGKILALGESPNDGEALAAIRMATKLARAAGMSLGEAVEAPALYKIHDTTRGAHTQADVLAAFESGRQVGIRAGAKEHRSALRTMVAKLETELEAYRAEIPWPDIAEAYFSRNGHGPRKEYAKGMIYHARTNRLQPEDLAELRRWDHARNKKNRRAA